MAVFSRNGYESSSKPIPMTQQNSCTAQFQPKSVSTLTPLHLKLTTASTYKRRSRMDPPPPPPEEDLHRRTGVVNGLSSRTRTLLRQDAITQREFLKPQKISRDQPPSRATPPNNGPDKPSKTTQLRSPTKCNLESKRQVKIESVKLPHGRYTKPEKNSEGISPPEPEVNNNSVSSATECLTPRNVCSKSQSQSPVSRKKVQDMIRNFSKKDQSPEHNSLEKLNKSGLIAHHSKTKIAKEVNNECVAEVDPLEFVVPLESRIQVVEGSPLELWVKAKGASRGIWLKKGRGLLPHAPPDLIQKTNRVDGSFCLRISDVFLEDEGLYICELYGDSKEIELVSWSTVEVLPSEDKDDEESLLEEPITTVPIQKLRIPLIITTSEEENMSGMPSSRRSSREDPLEDISEEVELPSPSLKEDDNEGNRKLEDGSNEVECSNISDSVQTSAPGKDDSTTNQPLNEFGNGCEKKLSMIPLIEEPASSKEPCSSTTHGPITPQSSTEDGSVFSEPGPPSRGSHSSAEVDNSVGYTGTFRDSLSDSPLSPRFLMGPSNLIVMVGETIHLRVKIWSPPDSLMDIVWAKLTRGAYKEVDEGTKPNSRIQSTQPTADLVMLTIQTVTYEDSGKYRVKISNSHGSDYHHCLVSVEGSPEPPTSPPAPQWDEFSTQLVICWSCCPFDGGSAIVRYILEMKPHSKESLPGDWSVVTPPSFKGLCFTLSRKQLCPGSTYVFRVCVENAHGKGQYSKESPGFLVTSSEGGESRKNSHNLTKSLSGEAGEYYDYKNVELKHTDFEELYEKHDADRLGKGRFGVVFKVTNKATRLNYAGKFVRCRKGSDKVRAELEYKIMNELKYHPKLICLVDAFEMPREVVIVTEMISGGELFERVVADDFILTERDCVTFLRQICDGVKYIHDKNVMHLDLKPENILLESRSCNKIKIIDFGLAQYYSPTEPISVLFGTAEFVSPEIISYDTICPATDMWSVGVITYILLSGLSPFLGDDDNETFSNITTGEFDFEDEAFQSISEDAKDFISTLILKRKELRLSAAECLEHKWLALSESEKTDHVLSTVKLKRFLLRRKWQAIRALGRITTLYSSSRRSSSGTSASSVSTPITVPGDAHLSSKTSMGEDSVFSGVDSQLSSHTPPSVKEEVKGFSKSKYDESCRSDSGIGGEVLQS